MIRVPIYDNIWNSILDSIMDTHPDWDAELIGDEADKQYADFIHDMDERSEVWRR